MPGAPLPQDRRSFLFTMLRGFVLVCIGGVGTLVAACTPTGTRPGGQGGSTATGTIDPVTVAPDNSIAGAQSVDTAKWTLSVTGLVSKPIKLTYEEFLARTPKVTKTITLSCVEGFTATYVREGIRLSDLLAAAGVRPGARTVIFRCHDGYSSSLTLSDAQRSDVLLVHHENGRRLIALRGYPIELSAPEKWGYKWAKWIERIEVSADTNFHGYWESRGYSNSGDLDKPFFGL